MKISQIQPWIDNNEADYINKVVKRGYLTENKETSKFEKFFEKKFQINFAISVSNWTLGIFACLKALNIGKNDEVIVPNLTFVATINAIILAGATPVICEVDDKNLSLDLNKVNSCISKKTKAIMPVHLYGHCCDMGELKRICKKKNIVIIEDAAQAILSKYKNKYLGTIGLLGGFSFYGNKIITTGEGGIILSNSKNLRIFKFYKKELSKIKSLSFMKNIPDNKPVYWFSNIFTNKKKKLKIFLKKNGIETRDIFYPINMQPCYRGTNLIKNLKNKFQISKKIYDTGLSLPSSYELNVKELKFVVKKIRQFFK